MQNFIEGNLRKNGAESQGKELTKKNCGFESQELQYKILKSTLR